MRAFYHNLIVLFFVLYIIGSSTVAYADPNVADSSKCSVRGSSGTVILLVCPPGLTQEAWSSAGQKACTSSSGVCNAWIWEDINKAPKKAPVRDADMNKEYVRNAVAVWINDAQRLITLRQVVK